MANQATEYAFVLGFWKHAATDESHTYVTRIMSGVEPEHIEHPTLRVVYQVLCERLTSQRPTDPADIEVWDEVTRRAPDRAMADQVTTDVQLFPPQKLGDKVASILESYNARRQRALLADSLAEMDRQLAADEYAKARAQGESTALRLLAVGAERPGRRTLRSREEITAELLAAGEVGSPGGIAWPYPKLQRVLGFLPRGAVCGITGEPGTGKTTVMGNLFMEWTARDVVVLVYSTEMRTKFLNRAYATRAGIPQRAAEQELFRVRDHKVLKILAQEWGCDELTARSRTFQYWEQYEATAREWEDKPWEVVDISDLRPEDLIGYTRHLRRRYAGAHVVVMVDHMLNLAYSEPERAALYVGAATSRFRDLCQEDQDGGMSGVLLFQPKKGEVGKEGVAAYRPVAAGAIKGSVASVLDVHFSPYRVLLDEDGKACRPNRLGEDGVRDDDGHVYLKPDKNRTGGPSPTQKLCFDASCGRIWEEDYRETLHNELAARMEARTYAGREAAQAGD